MEEQLTIVDRDVLKVLAVDTRMDMLKQLAQRSKTPSELSQILGKSSSTIVEHLDAMMKVGLVRKIQQPGKKWIYYELTEKGVEILSNRPRRMMIILSLSLLVVIGGFLFILSNSRIIDIGDVGVKELEFGQQDTDLEAGLKRFSTIEELQEFLKRGFAASESKAAVSMGVAMGVEEGIGGPQAMAPSLAESAASARESGGAFYYSTTNVQVAGVDEADIVKNDGRYIYIVSNDKVFIVDAYPAENARIVSTIKIGGSGRSGWINEIFVNGDKLVIFGNLNYDYPVPYAESKVKGEVKEGSPVESAESEVARSMPIYYEPRVFIYIYDIGNREKPVLERSITMIGNYVDSRMIGDYVYAILNSPIRDIQKPILPMIAENEVDKEIQASEIFYFDIPDYSYMFTTILSLNTQDEQEDYKSRVILMGATQNIFASLDNVYITYQRYFDYYDYGYKIAEEIILPVVPGEVAAKVKGVISSNLNKYEKYQRMSEEFYKYLYNLDDVERRVIESRIRDDVIRVENDIRKEMQKTIIHRIAIDDGDIRYEANGWVPGYVLNQFSMDEYDGHFRMATTTNNFGIGIVRPVIGFGARVTMGAELPTEAMPEPEVRIAPEQAQSLNHVYVLDMSLDIVGRLENLAPNENIFSARFMGKRAYLVTFRRIDPLFVIDLSNPSYPRVLGKLKIPGFSDYLHPYDENHIIGIGKEVTDAEPGFQQIQGVKLGIFDVSNPTNPREIAKYEIGSSGTDSEALRDHKAFLFSRQKNLLVIPISLVEDILPGSYGSYWQGAYVFDVSLDGGFKLKGRIAHRLDQLDEIESKYPYPYYYYHQIRRSLYIDDVLYTVSDGMVNANDLTDFDLQEIIKIRLPQQTQFGPGPYPTILE